MRTTQELMNFARKFQTITDSDYEIAFNEAEKGLRPNESAIFSFTGVDFKKKDSTNLKLISAIVTGERILIGGQVKGLFKANFYSSTFSISNVRSIDVEVNMLGTNIVIQCMDDEIVISEPTNEIAVNIVRELTEVVERIKETKQIASGTQYSEADEIRKFKELLDEGIITQEQFEAKKKQIFGF